MAIDLKKFIGRFVEEAREHIRQIHEGLARLDSGDPGVLHGVFRSAHTIKGSSRMLKLTPITEIAHRIEDVMAALREGSARMSPEMGEGIRRGVDAVSVLVDALAEVPDGDRLPQADPALLTELSGLIA
ncbi:MAG: Hpt domain-containing protein, partial [Magnetococcales bacterium]|nr:Hpt domain-containing protein [Magnetococcales bacterium]